MSEENKPTEEKPKIVVDEDWKAQAEKEREALDKQQAASGEQAKAPGAAGRAEQRRAELPPASFSTLVTGLTTQILFALGAIADPHGRRFRDLKLAKYHIDELAVLDQKTKGNLADEEKRLLDDALYQVRMAYVEAASGGVG